MKICFVSSECVPYVKTGGLADVSGALPIALAELGCEVKVVLPLYQSINTAAHKLTFSEELYDVPVQIGPVTRYFHGWHGKLNGSPVDVHLIECPYYYHRSGTYTSDPDEHERFILLQHAAFKVMQRNGWSPDVIHCNDWQTGLMPAYLRKVYNWDALFKETATLYSIHNIAYQGRFNSSVIPSASLLYDDYYPGGPYELHDSFCFMKVGVSFADKISTVSETYAHEIQTKELGADLDAVLRSRSYDLVGVLNGIDQEEWSPATDLFIPQNYDVNTLAKKEENKKRLLERFGMPYHHHVPVLGIVTRFAVQKGLELLQPIVGPLVERHGLQFVVLGSGEHGHEQFFQWASRQYPNNVGAYIGYNNELAHWIEAGADMFIMPSRYEPCGLNQMYSLKYGTVPIVRKTGGLADTVHDYHEFHSQGNGFSFVDFTPFALFTSISRALTIFRDKPKWREIQKRGMTADFSWDASARRYMDIYKWAIDRRKAGY